MHTQDLGIEHMIVLKIFRGLEQFDQNPIILCSNVCHFTTHITFNRMRNTEASLNLTKHLKYWSILVEEK